jgi:predicted phosphodiesterase
MNRNENLLCFLCTLVWLFSILSNSVLANQGLVSPLNELELTDIAPSEDYSFLVVGHAYGAPGSTLYPAGSLISGVAKINAAKPSFGFLLGDFLQHTRDPQLADRTLKLFKTHVGSKINAPLFVTPGNHDFTDPLWYQTNLGPDYMFFEHGRDSFLLLNTVKNGCNLGKTQSQFVIEKLNELKLKSDQGAIFVLMHQALWTVDNADVEQINPWVNGPLSPECNSFNQELLPIFTELSKGTPVYFISGDIGCKNYRREKVVPIGKEPIESFPVFYQKSLNNEIHYIASGLCGNENDNFLKFSKIGSKVNIEVISLSNKQWPKIQNLNVDFWQTKYLKESQVNIESTNVSQLEIFLKRVVRVSTDKRFVL